MKQGKGRRYLSPILLATTHPGKLREMKAALADLKLVFLSLNDIEPLDAPVEEGATFAENARIKSEYYFQRVGLATLADDSGLEVAALGGQPGVHSARFAATDSVRIRKLLDMLKARGAEGCHDRSARFVCALCLSSESGTIEVEGSIEGVITRQPKGTHGFGYDPVFFYPPLRKTLAELQPEEKNQISHRARALQKLRQAI